MNNVTILLNLKVQVDFFLYCADGNYLKYAVLWQQAFFAGFFLIFWALKTCAYLDSGTFMPMLVNS